MRLTWATDIHLDRLNRKKIRKFCDQIRDTYPEAVVLTGDLSESQILQSHLLVLEKELDPVPVFFVCGNHDYYNGSISVLRETLVDKYTYPHYEKGSFYKGAYWLGSSGVVPLTSTSALVGHDGWYDGGYANYFQSRLDMDDYYIIRELNSLTNPTKELRYKAIRGLAQESADYIRLQLDTAFQEGFTTVYVATHIPPFPESSTYKGKISDSDWLPHFSSKIMGDTLLEVAEANPDRHILVLCGHTHGSSYFAPRKNLEVYTGAADYGFPDVCEVFEV
jgi:Icc protein